MHNRDGILNQHLAYEKQGCLLTFSVGGQAVLIETQVCPKPQTRNRDTTLRKKDPSCLHLNSRSSKAPRDQSEDHQHSLCRNSVPSQSFSHLCPACWCLVVGRAVSYPPRPTALFYFFLITTGWQCGLKLFHHQGTCLEPDGAFFLLPVPTHALDEANKPGESRTMPHNSMVKHHSPFPPSRTFWVTFLSKGNQNVPCDCG